MVAEMTLDFYQIYYAEEQKQHLYDFAIPVFNSSLTPYFENSVIAELVPKSSADLVSVCSWSLKRKRGDTIYQLKGKDQLTLDSILNSDFDVAILTPRHHTNVKEKLIYWHAKDQESLENITSALREFEKFIHFPEEIKRPVYENHFIAKKEIYVNYVTTCLLPCIEFMSTRSVFMADSDYLRRKQEGARGSIASELKEKIGVPYYPIAPFILERLFSIWLNSKDYKIINL